MGLRCPQNGPQTPGSGRHGNRLLRPADGRTGGLVGPVRRPAGQLCRAGPLAQLPATDAGDTRADRINAVRYEIPPGAGAAVSERDLWLHAGGMHTAGPWHPEIGIEEYPHLSRREQKSLYDEIRNQGGPELLSNVYHPENWGSGDPAWDHHYVARDQDGTIHGILRAHRDYQKMEPKRQAYRDMWVHDVYTGNDAPKGTGSALMQAAAHRAMRDGADFSVQGVVPHASGFYHALGGTRKPNYSSFE